MLAISRSRRHLAPRLALLALVLAGAVGMGLLAPSAAEAATARVAVDGDCLRLRQSPSLTASVVTCIEDGSLLTTIGGEVTGDDIRWQQVRTARGETGYVAAQYIVIVPDQPGATATPTSPPVATPVATSTPAPPPTQPQTLTAPPVGGLTIGLSGTTSPIALVGAQSFPVAAISMIEAATQAYRIYIVGAPAFANSLTEQNLRPETVVMVRRTGDFPALVTAPPAASGGSTAVVGAPRVFVTPPVGGQSQGVAGTNDIAAVIAAQPFPIDIAMVLDVASQYWFTFIPGAPEFVNSLNRSTLRADTIVTLRRAGGATTTPPPPTSTPPPPPPPSGGFVPTPEQLEQPPGPATLAARAPSPTVLAAATPATATPGVVTSPSGTATISFYYCQSGPVGGSVGDGGGFCGFMASGARVYAGAASCARENRGQRFTIAGDPNARIYTCEDTGGGVRGNHRDIWFATSDEARAWWAQVAPRGSAEIAIVVEHAA